MKEFDDDPELVKKIVAGIDWKGIRADAMKTMGHVVEAYKGWVVKTYPDGKREKICKIGKSKSI